MTEMERAGYRPDQRRVTKGDKLGGRWERQGVPMVRGITGNVSKAVAKDISERIAAGDTQGAGRAIMDWFAGTQDGFNPDGGIGDWWMDPDMRSQVEYYGAGGNVYYEDGKPVFPSYEKPRVGIIVHAKVKGEKKPGGNQFGGSTVYVESVEIRVKAGEFSSTDDKWITLPVNKVYATGAPDDKPRSEMGVHMNLRDGMTRAFEIDEWEMRSDGRFVDGRIVPYMQPTDIVERDRKTGELVRYTEQFLPRSCMAMAQGVAKRGNAAFISFLMEHEEHDFNAKIGYATDLRDADDGAHATFKLYPGNDLDKVRAMLEESHKGLSVMFGDVRPPKVIDGIISRVQVHITHVAATPTPCYADALITGMRAENNDTPEYVTPKLNEVTEWLASIRK